MQPSGKERTSGSSRNSFGPRFSTSSHKSSNSFNISFFILKWGGCVCMPDRFFAAYWAVAGSSVCGYWSGCHSSSRIFLTQESHLHLLHWQADSSHHLVPPGKPKWGEVLSDSGSPLILLNHSVLNSMDLQIIQLSLGWPRLEGGSLPGLADSKGLHRMEWGQSTVAKGLL